MEIKKQEGISENMRNATIPRIFVRAFSTLALISCGGGSSTNLEGGTLPLGSRDSGTTLPSTGGTSGDGGSSNPTYTISLNTNRLLDLVFMIDNSPGMALMQTKLTAQFPSLIEAIKSPIDGTMPDLRVAIIDSDLGTGGAYSSGPCGPKNGGVWGDQGHFQMINAASCGVTSANALWLEYKQGQPLNYTGDISKVFTCLAGGLGTLGCGYEHQLQAFEFALVLGGIGNDAQQAMLRPTATLGLVFLSNEDDCSAATNYGMFQDPDGKLKNESSSLRCATRGHACNGKNLADQDPPNYPTDGPFYTSFINCVARMGDECPNKTDGNAVTDTSVPTACNPLKSVHNLAREIKRLKSSEEQILVAGIFGWPLSDADMATAQYKIAPVPNPNTADISHPQVYDYWPVCYDPNHIPSASTTDPATGFDATAAAWGATGGLRESAFIDEFGANGLKFSICQPDFADSMTRIGQALNQKMQGLCLPASYAQYASCTAKLATLDETTGKYALNPSAVPLCTSNPGTYPCYGLVDNSTFCQAGDYLVQVDLGSGANVSLSPGTNLEFFCQ